MRSSVVVVLACLVALGYSVAIKTDTTCDNSAIVAALKAKEVVVPAGRKPWYENAVWKRFGKTSQADDMNGTFCKICLDLVGGIEGMGEDAALGYIDKYSQELCDMIGIKVLIELCHDTFMGLACELVKLLNEYEDPDIVCHQVDLCY